MSAQNIATESSEPASSPKILQGEKHLRAVLDNMVDGVATIDEKGVILSWNQACCRIFGYEHADVVGRNISMMMSDHDRNRHDEYISSYLRTGHAKIIGIGREVSGRRKDGTIFPMDLSIGEINEGIHRTFVGIIRDITERKIAEEKLRKSHEAMDDFVYIVSHDLKEPLRGIYSYARFLEEDYGEKLDSSGQNQLKTLGNLAKRMEGLIDSLLSYSRIGRADLAFHKTDMNEVVKNTLELMEPMLGQPDVTVQISSPLPTIMCDGVYVSEVFRNLITNGLKYNRSQQKKIEIGSLYDYKACPGNLVFYVTDNGIGIEKKHHKDVFRMFKRLHGKEEYGGGTGSGLTIVKKIVERHNGKVWVESDGHAGTTFYFTIPQSS